MTPQERKVIELALEALLKTQNEGFNLPGSAIREAITAMKELLAQPEQEPCEYCKRGLKTMCLCGIKAKPKEQEQEPVAYGMWDTMLGKGHRMMMVRLDKGQDGCTVPLYTTPLQRTWVGLTDEDWKEIFLTTNAHTLPKAIEAKLKEKNI